MAAIAAAVRQGKTVQARRLIQAALHDNPRDTLAWTWACQVATTLEDRMVCLRQILAIDPDHVEARRYLAQLQAALPPPAPPRAAPPSPVGTGEPAPAARTCGAGTGAPRGPGGQSGDKIARISKRSSTLPALERGSAPEPVVDNGLPDKSWGRPGVEGLREPEAKLPLGPDPGPTARSRSISDLLLTPLGCLLQISTTHVLIGLLVIALAGGVIYYTANTDFFGMAGPDFDSLAISDSYQQLKAADLSWKVTYEKPVDSQFSGLVRGVFPIREGTFRILTHDILVTSGQYADPAIVSTSVLNHHFTWRSTGTPRPTGTINLLHTLPASQDIYRQLLEIRSDDKVTIGGREILTIQAYDWAGIYLGEWHDTGCNTLLVKSVSIAHK